MKHLFIAMLMALAFASCKKDEPEVFNFDKDVLVGSWNLTQVDTGGGYFDTTGYVNDINVYPIHSEFYNDGSYIDNNVSGTFKAVNTTISVYVSDSVYFDYYVITLHDSVFALFIYDKEKSININAIYNKE